MKRPSLQDIILDRQFPKPNDNKPKDFTAYVYGYLVPEVRKEIHDFYGGSDELEA